MSVYRLTMAPPPEIRSTNGRWSVLRALLDQIERLAKINVLIDVQSLTQPQRLQQAAAFESALVDIRRSLRGETTRLTAEGLRAELRHRQRQDQKMKERR